jgi:hypothetical protein
VSIARLPRAVAPRFPVRRFWVFTIAKALNPGHAAENAAAGEVLARSATRVTLTRDFIPAAEDFHEPARQGARWPCFLEIILATAILRW